MYAIIETGGKQYKVQAGDKVRVEKLNAEVGSTVAMDKVLFVGGENAAVGTPVVDGAKVEAKVLKQGKAKKVIVYKYKPKKGYHKKNGHRQLFTELEISSISFGGVTETAEEKAAEKEAEAQAEEVKEEVVEEVVEEAVEEVAEETEEAAEEVAEETEEAAEEAEEAAEEAAEEKEEAAEEE